MQNPPRTFPIRLLAILASAGAAIPAAHAQWTIVSLHPTWAVESEARSVFGNQQSGMANSNGFALRWLGSSPSVVQLNPVGASAATDSGAGRWPSRG